MRQPQIAVCAVPMDEPSPMCDARAMAVIAGRTGRNILANFVGQAVASLVQLALVPVYVRYLGIEAYALVGLFAVVQAWATLLDLGITPTLGREMARFTAGILPVQALRDLLRSMALVYAALAATLGIGVALAAPYLASNWLQVEDLPVETVTSALSLLGVVVALRFSEGLFRGALMGLQWQVWANSATVILALLRSFGALAILVFVSPTITAFFVWQALVSLITLATYLIKLNWSLPKPPQRPRFSLAALSGVKGFAAGVFTASMLWLLLTQADKVILSKLLPLADFGYYMIAATLSAGLLLVSGPVVLAVAPTLVERHGRGDEAGLSAAYHGATQLVSVLLGPAALMLILYPHGVLFAWSGDPVMTEKAAQLMAVLAIGWLFNGLMQVPHQLQLASGWTSMAVRFNAVAAACMIPLLLWAVPLFGAVAAAAIWAAINLAYLAIIVPILHRHLLRGALMRFYAADLAMPLLGSALVLVPALLIRPADSASRLEWIMFILPVGALSLFASAMLADTVRVRVRALIGR